MANQLMKTKKLLGGISQRLSHIFLKYWTGQMVPTQKGQILMASDSVKSAIYNKVSNF